MRLRLEPRPATCNRLRWFGAAPQGPRLAAAPETKTPGHLAGRFGDLVGGTSFELVTPAV
jgi:hypothetical protein